MKELSIEKVQAYNGNYKVYTDLINRLEDVKNAIKKQNYGIAMDILCKPYPDFQVTTHSELKESEDNEGERVRKEIIAFLTYYHTGQGNSVKYDDDWIAWLEKQGKNNMGISEAAKKKLDDNLSKALEKETPESCNKFLDEQAEQKPADKVEPKFKIGDYIISNNNSEIIYHITGTGINELGNPDYVCEYVGREKEYNNKIYNIRQDKVDANFKLWTIQDAKDGDVLAYRDGQWIFIYKEKIDDNTFSYYTLYSTIYQDLTINDAGFTLLNSAIIPATKEQCDILMKAMVDAGYTFDFEKKELRKIEQKQDTIIRINPSEYINDMGGNGCYLKNTVQVSTWSEEDNKIIEEIINDIECARAINYHAPKEGYEFRKNWLKSLKDHVQPKQEWSEEDEYKLNIIEASLKNYYCENDAEEFIYCIDWLKSLRPQSTWKPSDEQLKSLQEVIDVGHFTSYPNSLETLYEQLKKLREE